MNRINTWSISDPNPDGTVHVVVGHVHRGPAMTPEQAKDIVDCHHADRIPFEGELAEFQTAVSQFLHGQFSLLLNTDDPDTNRNYWYMLAMMTSTAVTQLSQAQQNGVLKFKPLPGHEAATNSVMIRHAREVAKRGGCENTEYSGG